MVSPYNERPPSERTTLSLRISHNPFAEAAAEAPTSVHAVWLATTPATEAIQRIRTLAAAGERFEVLGKAAYLHTPGGFGRSKMAALFDKWIGVPCTARNWNTVLKLAELGRAAQSPSIRES